METEFDTEKEGVFSYPFGSPRDVLTALFKHKNKIFWTFIVLFVGVAGWVYSQDTFYQAHTTLVLKFGRENIFRPEIGQTEQIIRFDQQAAIESERKIIESKDLVRRVVKAIGVEYLYPELLDPLKRNPQKEIESATSKFLGSLEAKSDKKKKTNLIEISFLHKQPEVAAQALNTLVEFLKERHLQIFSDPKASFLIGRLNDYENALKNAEESLQAFKQKHDLSSPLDDQQARLLDQRVALDTNSKTIKNELKGLASKVASLESQMKAIPEYVSLSSTEGPILAKAKADLFDLKRREQELLTRYTVTSAPVQNLQREIEFVEQLIAQTNSEQDKSVTSGKNPTFQKLEIERYAAMSDLKTRRASHEVIMGQINDLDQKLFRLDQLSEELMRLERARVAAEENYKLYVKKAEEAKVSEEMDQLKMSNIGIIQAADVPRSPAGKPKFTLLLLGTIFSAIMSVGLALMFEYFTGGYTRPDQAAEDLGLPVLASFSQKI